MAIDVIRSKIVIAGLSYIKPVFRANYLQIKVIAEVTMPDVLSVDIITPVDLVTLSTTKALSDTTSGFTDQITSVAFAKALTDSFTMEDSVDIEYWIEKNLADTQAVVENLTFESSKGVTDTAVLIDVASRAISKALTDIYTGFIDEITAISITKALTDSFTMEDSVDIEYEIQKSLEDTQTLADTTTRATSKALTDIYTGFTDQITSVAFAKALTDVYAGFVDQITTVAFTKALTDSFTMGDSADIEYLLAKSLADTQAIADLTTVSFSRPLSDTAVVSDETTTAATKALEEVLSSPTDTLSAVSLTKGVEDSQAIVDSIQTTLIFIRDVNDTLVSSDSPSFTSLLAKSEILVSSDEDDLNVTKGLSEGLNLIDNMDGDIEYDIIKLVGELLVSSDTQNIVFSGQVVDNVVTSSSGVLTMQDYCDITYFSEDYVGTSRTFT
jgi:hypothetical protein